MTIKQKRGLLAVLLMSSTAFFGLAGLAHAAEGGPKLEEVVVTARRTEERLQDVPIAVAAFSSSKMQTLGVVDATKLSNYTPGFEFTDYTNGRNGRGSLRYILMRGLYLANNNLLTSAALVFQDGAPVLSGEVLINEGIERVEVLKGPQNVYFGRSTFAGAINYVTRNPGNVYKGSVTAEAGRFNTYKLDGHIEGPIIEGKLTFGLDGQLAHKGGQYTNYTNPAYTLGERDTKSIAATLYATPTDKLSIKVFGNYYEYRDGPGAAVVISSTVGSNCNPGGTLGRVGGVITGALGPNFYPCGTGYIIPDKFIGGTVNYDRTASDALYNPPSGYGGKLVDCGRLYGLCTRNYTLHSIVKYELPYGMNFNAIGAYHKRPVGDLADALLQDTSGRPNPSFGNPLLPTAPRLFTSEYYIQSLTEDYSIEGRLSSAQDKKIRWTVGGNYVHAKNTTQLYFYTNAGAAPQPALPYQNGYTLAKTLGGFGGLYYEPIQGLIFAAEARYQQDELISVATTGRVFQKTYFATTPRFSVTYKATPSLNVYASYATGVRPGGFNAGLATYPAYILAVIAAQVGSAPIAYDQEKMWQAEVGVKGRFFDDSVSTNVAVYTGKLTEWQQTSSAILSPSDPTYGGIFSIIANTGAINLKGVEADGQWAVNRMLTLSGTFAYTHTEIEGSSCFSCFTITGRRNIDGNRLQAVPEYSATVAADLSSALTGDIKWFAHADVVYKSNRWNDYVNLSGTGAATLLNATVGVQSPDWSAALFGTNLTDDKHMTAGQVSSDGLTGSTTALRAGLPDRLFYGLRLKRNF